MLDLPKRLPRLLIIRHVMVSKTTRSAHEPHLRIGSFKAVCKRSMLAVACTLLLEPCVNACCDYIALAIHVCHTHDEMLNEAASDKWQAGRQQPLMLTASKSRSNWAGQRLAASRDLWTMATAPDHALVHCVPRTRPRYRLQRYSRHASTYEQPKWGNFSCTTAATRTCPCVYCHSKLRLDVRHCTIDSLIAICKIYVPSLHVARQRCLKTPSAAHAQRNSEQ